MAGKNDIEEYEKVQKPSHLKLTNKAPVIKLLYNSLGANFLEFPEWAVSYSLIVVYKRTLYSHLSTSKLIPQLPVIEVKIMYTN